MNLEHLSVVVKKAWEFSVEMDRDEMLDMNYLIFAFECTEVATCETFTFLPSLFGRQKTAAAQYHLVVSVLQVLYYD